MPAIPAPVAVTLDPKTTVLGILDMINPICTTRPQCTESLPAAQALLKKARDAKATVIFTNTAAANTIVPQLTPNPDETVIVPSVADKFVNTNLDDVLKKSGAKTLLIIGTRSTGAVLYSAFGANIRGYSVVVAEDGISGSVPFENAFTRWQLLNQPGFTNAENKPLAEKLVTLSRGDLISFAPGATPPAPTSAPGVPIPTTPAPVAVSLDTKTTALAVLDINSMSCAPRQPCVDTLLAIQALLKKARDAKVPVVYGTTTNAGVTIMSQVAPQAGEPTVASPSANKFYGSTLDETLKGLKVTTLVVLGTQANGAVLYSGFEANARGYTVVVADDGVSSATPFQTAAARWQLLNQPGFTNADNKPAAEKLVTLSRGDLISFK